MNFIFNLSIYEGLAFENGADVFPYGNGSGSVVLAQCQLHVKERHATEDGHQNVGDEESTCNGGTRGEMKVMMAPSPLRRRMEGKEICKLSSSFFPAATRFFFPDVSEDLRTEEVVL